MIINNIGYNHCHDADFFIDRPTGSGDNLLLLIKTPAIFTIDGNDITVPENSFFLYKKGYPQYYRCTPGNTFSNDWIHFLFEQDEEEKFLSLGLNYETPIKLDNPYFVSFCIKSISNEVYSNHIHKQSNISLYMFLIFNHLSERIYSAQTTEHNNYYELLSAVRNRVYSGNYQFFSVESSAHEVRMSKSNFQHLYKKFFGVTFIDDLINSRIEQAKMFLLNTNLTSADISKHCGYNNFAHFSRQFKKYTNMTPLEYRKKYIHKQ